MVTLGSVTSRQSENSLCFASISGVIYLEKNRAKLSSRVRQKHFTFKCATCPKFFTFFNI